MVGDALFPVALAFVVLELSGSATSLGLVLAAQAVPLTAFVLVGGVVADRISQRKLMLASDLVRGAAQAVTATILIAGVAEVWHLAVLAAIYGGAEAFFRPAAGGSRPACDPWADPASGAARAPATGQRADRHVPERRDGPGPVLAGVLIALTRPGSAIAIDAASFVVSAACLALMSGATAARAQHEPVGKFVAQVKDGWREVSSRRWLRSFMVVLGGYHLIALPCVLALGPVAADRELDGASSWAVIVTLFGVGAVIGAALGLRLTPRRPMIACGLAFIAASCQPVIIAGAGSTLAIGAFELLAGIGVAYGFTLWETTLGREIPARALSRVTSFDWFTSVGVLPIGYAIVGPLADFAGLHTTMYIASAVMVAMSVGSLAVADLRHLENRSEPLPPRLDM